MAEEPIAFTRNAGDPRQVKGAAAQAKRLERQRLGYYKAVLGTVDGRAMLWDVLASTGLYESSYAPSGSTVYFNEGRRNVGLQLRATLEQADEQAVEVMEREARIRRKQRDDESEARQIERVTEGQHG